MKILVTGGGGYIGSHTIVDLIENGFDVVSIDNHSRSHAFIFDRIETITGKRVKNYTINICNSSELENVFSQEKDIAGVIHFAAFKSVPESVKSPTLYYQNNINSLVNMLDCCLKFNVNNFVFSSSCSVYGNAKTLPVTEETELSQAESPYAFTKQIGEEILNNFSNNSNISQIILRYFNPVGAHPSSLIGELGLNKPENLVPFITQTAIGKLPKLTVFGNDYDTRDGSCIRDYIHVCDIAHAHTKAVQYLLKHTSKITNLFNLGTGTGISVLEAIQAFEKVSGVKLNYEIGARRAGDVIDIYANNNKAKSELNWIPKYDIDGMMDTAWKWELKLAEK